MILSPNARPVSHFPHLTLPKRILSQIIHYMKYAKYLPEQNRRENWIETVQRNVSMHVKRFPHVTDEIIEAFEYVKRGMILPSMRAAQFAGKAIEVNSNRIYNCSYCAIDSIESFRELFFNLLCGTGIGYSVQHKHILQLPKPKGFSKTEPAHIFVIPDTKEGWCDALDYAIRAYLLGLPKPIFDYSQIRPEGALLVTSGGRAPGPKPLKECLDKVLLILDSRNDNEKLKSWEVSDICCCSADATHSGGIRRAAMICVFDWDDVSMLEYKKGNDWSKNPERGRANISAIFDRSARTRSDFFDFWKYVVENNTGEPGIYWTNDSLGYGPNPCVEKSLRNKGFCNLGTINGGTVINQQDLIRRAIMTSRICTLQTSFTDFKYLSKEWSENAVEEALMGVSITGIAEGRLRGLNLRAAAEAVRIENERFAQKIGVRAAARCNALKPEGCLRPDTLIVSQSGILELQEIGDQHGETWQHNDMIVVTDRGNEHSDRFFVNGFAKTKKLMMKSGLILESTHKHKYRVITTDGDYIWKRTDEIKEGDMIPYRVGGYVGPSDEVELSKIEQKKRQGRGGGFTQILQPKTINKDLAWFLGLYWGDGSTHRAGIRISGDKRKLEHLNNASKIAEEQFGMKSRLVSYETENDNRCQIYFSGQNLLKFMKANDLIKPKTQDLFMPEWIRKSPVEVLKSFIDGYCCADGNTGRPSGKTYCTVSKKMAEQLTVTLRSIGIDAVIYTMAPTKSSYGTNNRYIVHERKGRSGDWNCQRKEKRRIWNFLDQHGLTNCSADEVITIQESESMTLDLSVPGTNTYQANSYISHNSGSRVLGTSCGIGGDDFEFYYKNIRVGKSEPIYKYLANKLPGLVEDLQERPETHAIFKAPIEAGKNTIVTEREPSLELLERVKKYYNEWIKPGHRSGPDTNNVSVTVTARPHEWGDIGNWMWENREHYNGIAVFPMYGGDHPQVPHEKCSKEDYERSVKLLKEIDLTEIEEFEDNTSHRETIACSGGSCTI